MYGPKFCSMRISAELHEYAREKGLEGLEDADAIEAGMREKAEEFAEMGGEVCVEAE